MSNLTEILRSTFRVDAADLDKAVSFQRKFGGQLEQILVSMGALSLESLPDLYAIVLQLERFADQDCSEWELPAQAEQLPLTLLLNNDWIPYACTEAKWLILTTTPTNPICLEALSVSSIDVEIQICSHEQLGLLKNKIAHNKLDSAANEMSRSEEARLRELASEAPTVNLLNSLITRALRQRASARANPGSPKARCADKPGWRRYRPRAFHRRPCQTNRPSSALAGRGDSIPDGDNPGRS